MHAFLGCISGGKETNHNLHRVYFEYVLGLATGSKLYLQICSYCLQLGNNFQYTCPHYISGAFVLPSPYSCFSLAGFLIRKTNTANMIYALTHSL